MHPQVIQTEPGNCPICGMALQRIDRGASDRTMAGVADHAPVALSPLRQQLIGVTRATVERRPLDRVLRTAGTIANDAVLYQLLIEHREALRTRDLVGDNAVHEARAGARRLLEASALKLRRAGIDAEALRAFAAIDPASLILPGRQVWIYAQVFEDEAPAIRPGMPVAITAVAFPDRTYEARVVTVDPTVNPTTRTVRVRALVATPAAELRPDSYVTASFRIPLGDTLAVPRDAILVAGERRLAFVVTADDRFVPREVVLGRSGEGFVEVIAGLAAGEAVVTSANFLIDSESRLRAALDAFGHAHAAGAP
jgi:Cu(I)/Ag(I) efflux system membrane fusion protein